MIILNKVTNHCLVLLYFIVGPIKKIFWFLVTCVAVGLFTVQAKQMLDNYLDYDVNVIVEMVHKRILKFPAVTGLKKINIDIFWHTEFKKH